jgi:translocation and assembly module TamB
MRFNSIIGAFVFIILASTLALFIFIQTRSFGTLLSRVISDISERKTNTIVNINNVKISFFPPGLELNKTSVKKDFSDGKRINAELGTIGLYFNLIEIEDRNLAFGEIKLSESVIEYTDPNDSNESLDKIDSNLINRIFGFADNLPLRIDTLIIENTKFITSHEILDARRLKLFKKGGAFTARFHLSNIKPFHEEESLVDEAWGDIVIGKKNIDLRRLKVQHDVHTLLLKGNIKNYPLLKGARASLNGEASIYLNSLKRIEQFPDTVDIESGVAMVNFNINLNKDDFEGEARVNIRDLKSNYIHAESISSNVSLQNKKILVSQFQLLNDKESASLRYPVIVADLNSNQLLPEVLRVKTQNLSINNVLRFLGPSFNIMKGQLTGNVSLNYRDKDFYFRPADGFKINNLGLIVGDEKPFQVLMVEEAVLGNAELAVVNKEFQISSLVNLKHSILEVDGFVNKDEVRFSVTDAKVNLLDFGNIANIDLVGEGRLSIDVVGPLDDTELKFNGKMNDFGVLGYQLGASDIDLGLSLKDANVVIRRLESIFGKTALSGSGVINYRNLDIALGINAPQAYFQDIRQILHPIFSKLDFLPEDLEFKSRIDAYIFGKTKLSELRVKSDVKFHDLVAFGETLDKGSMNVELINEEVRLKNIEASKGKGTLRSSFSYKIPKNTFTTKIDWDNLALSSFNIARNLKLNLDSEISGNVTGKGNTDNYLMRLENRFNDTRSPNYTFEDSLIKMEIMPQRFSGVINLLGSTITSNFDYSIDPATKSHIELNLDVQNLKPVAVAILGQHIEGEKFDGKLKFSTKSSFRHGFSDVNLRASIDQAKLNHEGFKLDYESNEPELIIADSVIKKWSLNIQQPDIFVATKGRGTFGKEVSLINEVHFNAKVLEILFSQILSAEGFSRNILRVEGNRNNYSASISSRADDLSFTVENSPFPINNLKYSLDFNDNRLNITEFVTTLENGKITVMGDVFFDEGSPDINLKYQLDRAEVPVLGKSVVNVSGEGIILGNNPPYSVGGELIINKALIVNELNEFNSRSSAIGQVRFLPKNQESPFGKYFNLNLNVKIENPISITNSMMDVALLGEMRLNGNPLRPRAEGRLYAPINSSRIFFKNNEYFISSADINFSPKKEITNPDFDIQAVTNISSYRVIAKAYGDLERFNFDLTSDPSLPRNSILSLIAFGYTDEIQSSLTQGEQQNLTQVGVGSFVFDRFKISDILNKQFGLQVNLGTVFEQSQTDSMLAGRSQEGQGTIGRTRSATKIELKKRLDEALTLSVSSTMGGSIGQRQSMNLTYSLNKKVQLEGVYELRTNAEGEEDIIDNSIGGDLKFRWTFK